jgi:hypothetical protein
MDRYKSTHCMAITLAIFESSRSLPVGTCKNPYNVTPVDNEDSLHHCTVDAYQAIHNYISIFERMRQSMMRHVEARIESHGEHLEHLL